MVFLVFHFMYNDTGLVLNCGLKDVVEIYKFCRYLCIQYFSVMSSLINCFCYLVLIKYTNKFTENMSLFL
jgi:hypothetical protein